MYKLTPGVAPKSFGLNVARLAQLPEALVQRAAAKASEMSAARKRHSTCFFSALGRHTSVSVLSCVVPLILTQR